MDNFYKLLKIVVYGLKTTSVRSTRLGELTWGHIALLMLGVWAEVKAEKSQQVSPGFRADFEMDQGQVAHCWIHPMGELQEWKRISMGWLARDNKMNG